MKGKFEIRSTKFETNPKPKGESNQTAIKLPFRISSFEFRISAHPERRDTANNPPGGYKETLATL